MVTEKIRVSESSVMSSEPERRATPSRIREGTDESTSQYIGWTLPLGASASASEREEDTSRERCCHKQPDLPGPSQGVLERSRHHAAMHGGRDYQERQRGSRA